MSLETKIDFLSSQVSDLNRKLNLLLTEKSLNEDTEYLTAISEAKKGNYKALQLYARKRFESGKSHG